MKFFFLLISFCIVLNAQPRESDAFMRKKIFVKIDLLNKINSRMLFAETEPDGKSKGLPQGIIEYLVLAYKKGEIKAYNADSLYLEHPYAKFDDFIKKQKHDIDVQEPERGPFDETEYDEDEDMGMKIFEVEEIVTDTVKDAGKDMEFIKNMSDVMGLIEDMTFDKQMSETVYKVQYLILYYADPMGVVSEEAVLAFKFDEVEKLLSSPKCKRLESEEEVPSLFDIFVNHSYNRLIYVIGGEHVLTTDESYQRKREWFEFEHNLWNF